MQIIAKEGTKSLFKGAGANILRGVAGAGVLSLYDKLQQVMFGKVYSGGLYQPFFPDIHLLTDLYQDLAKKRLTSRGWHMLAAILGYALDTFIMHRLSFPLSLFYFGYGDATLYPRKWSPVSVEQMKFLICLAECPRSWMLFK
jgi:hypothetical protein